MSAATTRARRLREAPRSALPSLTVGFTILATTLVIDTTTIAAWALATGDGRPPPLWILMAATTAVALSLPVVARRAERLGNRLRYGEHVDGYAMMALFVRRMGDTIAVDEVLPRLAETAARSTHSSYGEAEVWLGDGRQERQVWPPDTSGGASRLTVSVQHGGDVVGALSVDSGGSGPGQPKLNALVGPAGLALSTVRLTQQLRARLAETVALASLLRASQERIVEARRVQRGRVQSELGRLVVPPLDAAEQALVSAAVAVVADPSSAAAFVLAAEDAARVALEALRHLAQGVFPPLLDQAGLAVAIEAWADRAQMTVNVGSADAIEALRRHAVAQACVYFCCVSVLTDLRDAAIRTADVTISFAGGDEEVRFSVQWQDCSAAPAAQTVVDVTDRLEALGGTCLLGAPDGRAASLAGIVPVAPLAVQP